MLAEPETLTQRGSTIARARVLCGAAAAGGLALTVLTSVVLTFVYRPDAPWPDEVAAPSQGGWSGPVVAVHQALSGAAVLLCLIWLVVSAAAAQRRSTGRMLLAVGAGLAAVVCSLVAAAAWYLVKWDQLALWAVTVGSDLSGLWDAAFSDEVRFILIGGAEVGQGSYTTWLVVFLVAPVAALAAVGVGWSASGGEQGAGEALQRPQPTSGAPET